MAEPPSDHGTETTAGRPADEEGTTLVRSLLDDQRRRWRAGEPLPVEEYLTKHPALRDDPEGLLDLIHNEVVLREEQGESPGTTEYETRFPTLAAPLGALFEAHTAIGQSTAEAVVVDTSRTSVASANSSGSALGWPSLEGYEVLDVLGRGGMGIVYRARDRRRGVMVAVKTMQQVDAGSIYRFKQEFRTLLDVSHPNLITLHELISDGRSWYIVMEFIDGMDFLDYVRLEPGRKPLSGEAHTRIEPPRRGGGSSASSPEGQARLRQALRQLADGLTALHQAGKLHRDIKPSNVLVTHQGHVVLMDFGLVTEESRGDSTEGQLVGTVGYMSPEQSGGLHLSPASDWYSVGVMLFEALTGRLPFTGSVIDVITQKQRCEAPAPSTLEPGVPEDLDALCVEMLRRDPRARPPANEVLRRLGDPGLEGPLAAGPLTPLPGADLPFVGREAQRAALADALEAMTGGRTVVVFVRGRSGVGKSALVQRFLDEVSARNAAVVVSGRCYERESVPYKALDSLIDALSRYLRRLPTNMVKEVLPRDVGPLARVFPVLRRVDAFAEAPRRAVEAPDPQELRRRAYAALRELLARLGDRRPLVLAIDDLQWGDVDSLAVLSEILRPPDPPVLLLVGCYRVEEAADDPFLRALIAWSEAEATDRRELDVEPLSLAEAHALALRLLGEEGPVAERRASAIAQESGGNPFFVAELTRSVQCGDRDREAPAKAGEAVALDEVLWSRVLRLPDEARRLLEVVSVSGRPLPPSVAWQCLGEVSGDERSALALLRSGRLVRFAGGSSDGERVETYHDRVRQTVVARLGAVALSDWHRRLASALEASGTADLEVLGVHFQEAGDPERAGAHFARAAAQAAEALAFDRAATLYRLALELCATCNGVERRRLRAGLGEALANAGRGAEAAHAYLSACEGAEAAEGLEFRRRAAMQFLISGHIDQGLAALRDVLTAVGMSLPKTPRQALASLLLRRAMLRLRGLGFKPRDARDLPAADITRIDVSWSAAIGLSNVDWVRGADFQVRGLLLALRAGEPYRIARALAVEAAQAATGGSATHRRTTRLLEQAEALASRTEQPYAQGMVRMAAGVAAYLEGRWHSAVEHCDSAEAVFRDRCTGVAWELDTAHAYALWALSHLGQWGELSRRFPVLINEARERGDLYAVMNLSTYILSIVRLAADEPAAAREETMRVMGQWSRDGYHVQHNDQVWASVQIELYAGNGALAWERIRRHWPILSRSLLLRVQFIRIAMHGLRARSALAAAAGDGPLVRSALRDAAVLEREGTPWARAQARMARAGVAALRGNRDESLAHLQEAVVRFRDAGMDLCAVVAERRQGELQGGAAGRALQDRADDWMADQSIRRPAGVVAMFAPGFPSTAS